jgi:uroporphyrinogen-III decarboxylase
MDVFPVYGSALAYPVEAGIGPAVPHHISGIDAQHVLPFASPEEVREHVRRNIEIFKTGGGYVFNNIHNIQAGMPAENIVVLFDAAYEYGFYN